jgi:hypothetical protein
MKMDPMGTSIGGVRDVLPSTHAVSVADSDRLWIDMAILRHPEVIMNHKDAVFALALVQFAGGRRPHWKRTATYFDVVATVVFVVKGISVTAFAIPGGDFVRSCRWIIGADQSWGWSRRCWTRLEDGERLTCLTFLEGTGYTLLCLRGGCSVKEGRSDHSDGGS